MSRLIEAKCAERALDIQALAIQSDHIHLFARVWPSDSAAEVVKECKGITSFALRKEFPQLRKLPSMWTRSYFARLPATSARTPFNATLMRRQASSQASNMDTVRKTYKEKLRPTPAQERALEEVLWRCRDLYNVALEQRITAWQRATSPSRAIEQEAELKDIRAEFPEYAAIH